MYTIYIHINNIGCTINKCVTNNAASYTSFCLFLSLLYTDNIESQKLYAIYLLDISIKSVHNTLYISIYLSIYIYISISLASTLMR